MQTPLDPMRVVPIEDYSPSTLQAVVTQLERSTHVDHLIYRESELDALWSLLDLAIRRAQREGASAEQLQALHRLFDAAREAHDLVGADDPAGAAQRLRQVLKMEGGSPAS